MIHTGEDVIYSPEYQASETYQRRLEASKQRHREESERFLAEWNRRSEKRNQEYINQWHAFGWARPVVPMTATITWLTGDMRISGPIHPCSTHEGFMVINIVPGDGAVE